MAEDVYTLIVPDLFDVEKLLAQRKWRKLHEGVFISEIYSAGGDGPMAALLHYLPGAAVPEHLHNGYEHILVLSGEQRDPFHCYPAGTLAIQPPGHAHDVVSPAGCVALAIWARPVSLLQPGS